MKTYWGVEVYFDALVTSSLDGVEWLAARISRFTFGLDRRLTGPKSCSVGDKGADKFVPVL